MDYDLDRWKRESLQEAMDNSFENEETEKLGWNPDGMDAAVEWIQENFEGRVEAAKNDQGMKITRNLESLRADGFALQIQLLSDSRAKHRY